MWTGLEGWIGLAVLVVAGLAAFSIYRWRQRRRVRRVGAWVRGYLADRYGEVPAHLHVSCSDDRLWPVLADFNEPRSGARRQLRFSCPGANSTFSPLPEQEAGHEPAAASGV
jgi:hypothetical protein